MEQTILSLNGGSSSLKFAVYRFSGAAEERIFSGAVEAIGQSSGKAWLRSGDKALQEESGKFPDHTAAIKTMFAALRKQGVEKLAAAGHRIVHGGPKFTTPQLIDEKSKGRTERADSFCAAPSAEPGGDDRSGRGAFS